jgi:hypothetical protein
MWMFLVYQEIISIVFMNILKITHDAGFFSSCSKRLEGIIWFFNKNKSLPDLVDSSSQFSLLKLNDSDDLSSLYFKESNINLSYKHIVDFYNDMQFLDYKDINFGDLKIFIEKYFSPSDYVRNVISSYDQKYHINYEETCAVFYRGNDKFTETSIAAYESFILKAKEVKKENPNIKFLVQTDEEEFLQEFLKEFPESVFFEETPRINRKNSSVFSELPPAKRAENGVNFLAAVIVLSKCKYIVTHSGNCGLWCLLYRGNSENVYQWLNNSWNYKKTLSYFWQKNKRHVKGIFNKNLGWVVIK